jgi:hypothetical protein
MVVVIVEASGPAVSELQAGSITTATERSNRRGIVGRRDDILMAALIRMFDKRLGYAEQWGCGEFTWFLDRVPMLAGAVESVDDIEQTRIAPTITTVVGAIASTGGEVFS